MIVWLLQEGLIDGVKQEEGQDELDEMGAPIPNSRRVRRAARA